MTASDVDGKASTGLASASGIVLGGLGLLAGGAGLVIARRATRP